MGDELLIRCSSLGKIMTNAREVDPSLMTDELRAIKAKTKRSDDEKALLADALSRSLSETAKSHIRSLAAQAIYGVEFEISSKPIEKGLALESEAIALVNRVRGLALVKNTERRSNGYLTGEADCFDAGPRIGHDTKVAWSVATFPIVLEDCYDDDYLWQMRGYMMLWDAEEWHVDYALLDTPEHLIGYEPQSMHFVSHIAEHMRLTSWVVKRDRSVEPLICAKVELARKYLAEVIAEFDRTHSAAELEATQALQAAQKMDAPPAGPVGDGSQKPNGDGQDCPARAGSDTPQEGLTEVRPRGEVMAPEACESATGRGETVAPALAAAPSCSPCVGTMGAGQAADAAPADGLPELAKALDALAGLTDLAPVIRAPGGPITMIEPAPAPADEKPTLNLGAINDWLAGPVATTAAGLALLGIHPSSQEKAAKLYKPSDKARIKAALIEWLEGLN